MIIGQAKQHPRCKFSFIPSFVKNHARKVLLLQFTSVHSRMNYDSDFFFVCRLINWLSDQGRGKDAEEQAVHVAHDHQATRDAAETRSKKSPLETD